MAPSTTADAVRKSPRTIRKEAITRRNKAIDERNRAIDERNRAIDARKRAYDAEKKVPARRKLNDDKKLSGNKLNKKRKTVSTNSESPKDMEQLESPTKSKKKRQSIETGGAVAKAVQARRFLSDNAQATAASTLPARETGSVMDRLDSGGKQSTSGTRKVAKAVRKKTLLQVARALEAGRRKDGDPLEMDDSDLEEDVDDSYVVDTSDDSNSVVHESSSEDEEVVMEGR